MAKEVDAGVDHVDRDVQSDLVVGGKTSPGSLEKVYDAGPRPRHGFAVWAEKFENGCLRNFNTINCTAV